MVDVSSQNNSVSINVSSSGNSASIKASPDTAQYYSEKSREYATSDKLIDGKDYSSKYYANKSAISESNAKDYAQSSQDTYNQFQQSIEGALSDVDVAVQGAVESIDTKRVEAVDSINSTKTTILNDIEFVADGEKKEIEDLADLIKDNAEEIANRTSFAMFDTILKDHVLTYEESKGLALQGTYVYKDAVAGSRYGYADFYNKCLEEYKNSITEQVYLKSNVTVVGSPTDNKGLLSGFSKTNYVTLPNHFLTAVANADTWEAEFRFTTGSSVTSPERQCIFHSGVGSSTSGVGGFLADIYQGKLRISYDTNNSSGATAQITASTYTEYFIKATFDYSTLTFSSYYKLNENDDWTLINSLSVNGRLAESANWNATEMGNSSTDTGYYFTGSINLNDCYINIDGERWWSGVDNLEYKKNSNGHLFYDINQKDQIDEIFESTGMAWLYGVDTENERVFLPRNNWFEQAGNISEVCQSILAGLPNLTGSAYSMGIGREGTASSFTGVFTGTTNGSATVQGGGDNTAGKFNGTLKFDASKSNNIYGNSDTVQPNAVKKLLYICVGNTETVSSVTDVVDVTTTENDTIPLGYHFYQAGAQPSVSYMKSEGQQNDGNIYTTFYNEFVKKIGQPFAGGYVKEYTDSYDDYDLVINQDEMTFRLPLLDGSETIPDYTDYTEISNSGSYVADKNCYVAYFAGTTTANGAGGAIVVDGVEIENLTTTNGTVNTTKTVFVKKGQTYALGSSANFRSCKVFACIGNGSLYFKVANAVQNLELLDAGEVLEAVNNVVPDNSSLIASYTMPSSKYVDLTLGASGTSYIAPANGWFYIHKNISSTQYVVMHNVTNGYSAITAPSGTNAVYAIFPVSKGNEIMINYTASGTTNNFKFYYAQGEV